MNKKNLILIIAVVLMAVFCIFAYFVFQRLSQESILQETTQSDYSFDADGFLWGTEAYLTMLESPNGQKEIDAISNTLKVKNIKFRVDWAYGKNLSNIVCIGPNCLKKYDLDKFAQIFKQNSWSMRPMFSLQPTEAIASVMTDSDIDDYVDYIDWFIARYKKDANIKYIELINNPVFLFINNKTTLAQLIEIQNKVYDRVKNKYPDIMVGTHGFEYNFDGETTDPLVSSDSEIQMVDYFLDKNNGAKFDYWAFHGYAIYPPVQTAVRNKYAGVAGVLEIRKKMDANGWQDRQIIDTEHVPSSGPALSNKQDKFDAALAVQELVVKRTLKYNGKYVLAGVTPLKIIHREAGGEMEWGSLKADSSLSRTMKATSLLWSKLKKYNYSSRVSGEFDNFDKIWMEKFQSGDDKELYVFFKPFPKQEAVFVPENKSLMASLDVPPASYTLNLKQKPASIVLTDINGNTTAIIPSQTITLKAVNSPKFLEVEY